MITSVKIDEKAVETTVSFAGQKISFLNLGATITRWMTKDGTEIVPSYQNYADYQAKSEPGMYLGATVGPIAGRIKNSSFNFNGKSYAMKNDYPSFLHSGKDGMAFKYFTIAETGEDQNGGYVVYSLNYRHPTFPASLVVNVRYTINRRKLEIDYDVTAKEDSLVNMTGHVYFNLDGDTSASIFKTHELVIPAKKVVLVDKDIIGDKIIDVCNTGFDFQKPRFLADMFNDAFLVEESPLGIDNYYMLDPVRTFDAKLHSIKSNKTLIVRSDYPGITLYTGNYPGKMNLNNGKPLVFHGAMALEPHFQTNAVNDNRFVGYYLGKGQKYHHTISYELEEEA